MLCPRRRRPSSSSWRIPPPSLPLILVPIVLTRIKKNNPSVDFFREVWTKGRTGFYLISSVVRRLGFSIHFRYSDLRPDPYKTSADSKQYGTGTVPNLYTLRFPKCLNAQMWWSWPPSLWRGMGASSWPSLWTGNRETPSLISSGISAYWKYINSNRTAESKPSPNWTVSDPPPVSFIVWTCFKIKFRFIYFFLNKYELDLSRNRQNRALRFTATAVNSEDELWIKSLRHRTYHQILNRS